MKETFRRSFAAWLLLSAYVPLLLLSALHIHPCEAAEGDDCALCAQHVDHPAHFTTARSGLHDCALCYFLRLSYTAAALAVLTVIPPRRFTPHVVRVEAAVYRTVNRASLRAPPFVPCVN